MRKLDQFDFDNQKVLVRVDFNVPLNDDFRVVDDTKIRASLPTIRKILDGGGAVIIMSHLGRPKGHEERFSQKHIVSSLSSLLGVDVKFAYDTIGEKVRELAFNLHPGEVLLLENTRFYEEEKTGNDIFARHLASMADIYINDAFATAHRAHASTTIVAKHFSGQQKGFGELMAAEIRHADEAMNNTSKPFTLILGGSKVSDKIEVIHNMLPKIDNLLIGGAMAYTFFKSLGGEIGKSSFEEDKLDVARSVIEKANEHKVRLILPEDSITADDFSNDAKIEISENMSINEKFMGLDIGPKAIDSFIPVILESNKILWNGTMGVYEMSNFSQGTRKIGEAIFEATKKGAFSLVGGGDTVAAVKKFGQIEQVTFASTGGGALLQYFEGKELPGIKAIKQTAVQD